MLRPSTVQEDEYMCMPHMMVKSIAVNLLIRCEGCGSSQLYIILCDYWFFFQIAVMLLLT